MKRPKAERLKFFVQLTDRELVTLRGGLIQMTDPQRWTDDTCERAKRILSRLDRAMGWP